MIEQHHFPRDFNFEKTRIRRFAPNSAARAEKKTEKPAKMIEDEDRPDVAACHRSTGILRGSIPERLSFGAPRGKGFSHAFAAAVPDNNLPEEQRTERETKKKQMARQRKQQKRKEQKEKIKFLRQIGSGGAGGNELKEEEANEEPGASSRVGNEMEIL